MLAKSINAKIKAMDVYKRIPRDLSEATFTGAIISVISIAIVLLLFTSELKLYLNYNHVTDMEVNQNNPYDTINMNLQIQIKNIPCEVIRIESSNHQYLDQNNITYQTINQQGHVLNQINQIVPLHKNDILNLFNQKLGCLLTVEIRSDSTPGNLMLNAYNNYNEQQIRELIQEKQINLDFSHTIKYLNFGDIDTIYEINNAFSIKNQLQTLNDYTTTKSSVIDFVFGDILSQYENKNIFYEYYINIVNSNFIDINEQYYQSVYYDSITNIKFTQFIDILYEFTANTQQFYFPQGSLINIKYDVSPLIMTYIQTQKPFSQFIVQLFAIIGGVFTVAGILDQIVHSGVQKILKKHEMGKLY